DTTAGLQYDSGKLPEYVDALTGRVEDDGLNINDDTPLFIMAANHHFRCTADEPRGNVWAIASWRNIIANYSINGAVTEINAECAAALRDLAHLAERVDADDADVQQFAD